LIIAVDSHSTRCSIVRSVSTSLVMPGRPDEKS
jgi:hypothetical protein